MHQEVLTSIESKYQLKRFGQIPEAASQAEEANSSSQEKLLPPKSMVAFSESEGEEYVEIGKVRALNMGEVLLIREKFWKRCEFCNTVKPPRTHHCSQCNRCVVRMDHHCVWIGNCVGLHNMKPFLLFLFYSMLTTVVSVVLFTLEIFRCFVFDGSTNQDNQNCNLDKDKIVYNICMSLTGVGLFFILCLGFLTLAVWFSQIQRIRENLTLIDRMQLQVRLQQA